MIGLVRAELLKLTRRWATWVVLALLLGMMTLVYLLVGFTGGGARPDATGFVTRFPAASGIINQFVFGLGSLLAVAWAAALAGGDWNWGVIRVIVARGEGRIRYVLAKAFALALALIIAVLIAYAAGIALTMVAAALLGGSAGDPFAARTLTGFGESIAAGTLVLLQRAAIGFAVAIVLRSQLAGVVVGILFSIGEGILSTVLLALSFRQGDGDPIATQWFQYLPFGIGDSLLAIAPGPSGNLGSLLGEPVAPEIAAVVVAAYLVAALVIASIAAARAEIAG